MMSDIDLLSQIIVDTAIVSHTPTGNNKCSVDLSENRHGNISYNLKINGIPEDSVTFRADNFPEAVGFYRGDRGENKRADYVIVAKSNNKKWILFIEVKSGKNYENKEIVKQLKGAECVVAHCRAVAKRFWNANSFLDSNIYENRFISIVKVNMNKLPTCNRLSGKIHNKPENMLKLGNHGKLLRFSRLIAN